MLDRLDEIPWKRLRHAYGPAEDVPDLLRSLRTAPAEMTGERSPLWHLCGNIWHQGTVYEATPYAVPFLIELASCPLVPDRLGILGLLAAIATGSSFRDVHGNLLNEPDFAERKAVELKWSERAHAAVASGIAAFLAMTGEETGVRLAAAHVLALLPKAKGGDIWFSLDETRPLACFAGIWTNWTSVRKVKEGETTNDLYAFLTTEPNAEVGAIHPKAMPVILTTPEQVETWMTAPPDEALNLQRPLPDGVLRIVARGVKEDPAEAA
jgi:hypothetical protein